MTLRDVYLKTAESKGKPPVTPPVVRPPEVAVKPTDLVYDKGAKPGQRVS